MRPAVGLNPTTPQYAAGRRTEAPVSLPTEAKEMPAATAAAEPLLEPPATWSGFHGFTAAPKCEAPPVGPKANSCRFVLPTMTAPASRRRSVGAAFVSAVAP